MCFPQYGLLAKATDAGGGSEGAGDTPGYVYKELTELTFEGGPRVGAALAQTLTKRLTAAHDVQSKLKTLKTIRHLAQHGSRRYRALDNRCLRYLPIDTLYYQWKETSTEKLL